MVASHILSRVSHMVMRIRTVMVNHGAGLCPPCLDDQQSIFLPWFFSLSSGINDANFTSKMPLFLAPDIDECYTENECHQNATCNNTKGSYRRTCKGGFMADGRVKCTGKILLNSIPNHQSQSGTFLSFKTELPATFEWIRLTKKEFSVSFVIVCFIVFPSKTISVPRLIDKLQIGDSNRRIGNSRRMLSTSAFGLGG